MRAVGGDVVSVRSPPFAVAACSGGLPTPELVIFDCDGVLVDSEVIACRVFSETLARFELSMTPQDVMELFVGRDFRSAKRWIEERFDRGLPPDFDARNEQRLEQAFAAELKAFDGMSELLETLSIPACVASNSSHYRLRHSFRSTQLARFFEQRVYSVEDVARPKPAPDLYLHAARSMRMPPESCIAVEDSVSGAASAKAAGIRVIGFCAGSHAKRDLPLRLREVGCEAVVQSTAELRSIFQAFGIARR